MSFFTLLYLKLVGAVDVSWCVVLTPLLVVLTFVTNLFVALTIINWRNK